MPLELIAPVANEHSAKLWSTPATRLSVPVGARKHTYRRYSVVAADDDNRVVRCASTWERITERYPIKYAISPTLEDAQDAALYVEQMEQVALGRFTPVYRLANEHALRTIPKGSHVSIAGTIVSAFGRLRDYSVWIPGSNRPRHQWLSFCELVVRGVIPVAVILPAKYNFARGLVIRRGLVGEQCERDYEWIQKTSVQNIIAHWEVIATQYNRICRAGNESPLGSVASEYGPTGIGAGLSSDQ